MFSHHGHSTDRMFLLLETVFLTAFGVHWFSQADCSISSGSWPVSVSLALVINATTSGFSVGTGKLNSALHTNNKAISPVGPLPPFYHADKYSHWSPDVREGCAWTPAPTWHDLDRHRGRFWHTRQRSSQGRAARNVSSSGRVWRWGPEGQRPMVQTGLQHQMWPTGSKPSRYLLSLSISKGVTRQALLIRHIGNLQETPHIWWDALRCNYY